MNPLVSRLLAVALTVLVAELGCNRSDEKDTRFVPARGAPAAPAANSDPVVLAPASGAPTDPTEAPVEEGPGGGPAPSPPGAPGRPGAVPFSPLPFPWPMPILSALPALPFQVPRPPGLPAGLPWPGSLPQVPGGLPVPGGSPRPPGAVQPESQAQVVVYGTQWCPACKSLKQDLAGRRVPYSFIDIENEKSRNSPAGQQAADKPKNMNGVPQTRVTKKSGQVIWVLGADGARIEREYRS